MDRAGTITNIVCPHCGYKHTDTDAVDLVAFSPKFTVVLCIICNKAITVWNSKR